MSTKKQNGDYYDGNNPFKFHSSEIEQGLLYTEINDDEKYRLWSKINTDLTLFDKRLEGYQVKNAKTYVNIGETLKIKLDDYIEYSDLDTINNVQNLSNDEENYSRNLNLNIKSSNSLHWVKIANITLNNNNDVVSKNITLLDRNKGGYLSFKFSINKTENTPLGLGSYIIIYENDGLNLSNDKLKIITKSINNSELWLFVENENTKYRIFENNSLISDFASFTYDILKNERSSTEPNGTDLGLNITNSLINTELSFKGNELLNTSNANNDNSNWITKDLSVNGLSTFKDDISLTLNKKIIHSCDDNNNIIRTLGTQNYGFEEKYLGSNDGLTGKQWTISSNNTNKGILLDHNGKLDANILSEDGVILENKYASKSDLTKYDKSYENISKLELEDSDTYLETSLKESGSSSTGKYIVYKDVDDSFKKIKSGDSDKLSNQPSSYYLNASNISSGILSNSRISKGQLPNNPVLLNNSNLNDITVPGFYRQTNNINTQNLNYPTTISTGSLFVIQDINSGLRQIFRLSNSNKTFERNLSNTWTVWDENITSDNANKDIIDWKAKDLYESGVKISDKYLQISNANNTTTDWVAKDLYEVGTKLSNKYLQISNANNDTTDWRAKDLYENGVKISDKYLAISGSGLNTSNWDNAYTNMGKLYSDKTSQYEQVSISNNPASTSTDSYITYKDGLEYIKLRSGYSDNSGKLNDQDSSYYLNADNINSGELKKEHNEEGTIPYKSKVLTSVNLNDIIESGFYNIASSFALTSMNFPKMNANGSLEVLKESNNVIQKYVTLNNELYIRTYKNSIWSDWFQQYNKSNTNNDTTDWRARKLYESGTSIEEKYATKNSLSEYRKIYKKVTQLKKNDTEFWSELEPTIKETIDSLPLNTSLICYNHPLTGIKHEIGLDKSLPYDNGTLTIDKSDNDVFVKIKFDVSNGLTYTGDYIGQTWNGWKGLNAFTENITLTQEGLISKDFITKVSGFKFGLESECDNFLIRKKITCTDFNSNNLNIQHGNIVISDNVEIETATHNNGNGTWKIKTKENIPFSEGGKVKCQYLDGTNVIFYIANIVALDYYTNLGRYKEMEIAITEGTGIPNIDQVLTRRNGGTLYLNSTDIVNGGYLDILHNDITKTRIGDINNINDSNFGQLSGQGIYSDNFNGKGNMILGNKSSIDFANVNNSPNIVGINLRKLSDYEGWLPTVVIHGDREIEINIGRIYNEIGGGDSYNNLFPNIDFKANTQYTFSGEMKTTATAFNGLRMNVKYTDGTESNIFADYHGTGVYRPFNHTSTKGKSIAKIICSYWSGGYEWLKDFKIEKGTVATDWSLAPEDITGRLTHIDANGIYSGQAVLGGFDIDTNMIRSVGGGLINPDGKLGHISMSNKTTDWDPTKFFDTGGRTLQGFSIGSNSSNTAYNLVMGQMMGSRTGIKEKYFGIQMMDESAREYFALGFNTETGAAYNRIADWAFDSNTLRRGSSAQDGNGYLTDPNGILFSNGDMRTHKTKIVDGILYTIGADINASTITCTGNMTASNFILSSDKRKKENITDININVADSIKAVNYNMIEDKDKTLRNGYIAQDVDKVDSSLVYKDKEGFLSVDYIGIHTLKIANSENKIKTLENKIKILENKIKKLSK